MYTLKRFFSGFALVMVLGYIEPLSFKEPVKPSLVLQWFSEVVNVLYGSSYGST